MRRSGIVLGVALALVSTSARANGRFPAANQLVARPGDPAHLLLRTTFGILASSDSGTTWDWLCEAAVGYGGTEDPSLAITGDGSIVAGTFEGLSISHDVGCGWAFAAGGLEKGVVVDVVVRPDAPSTAFVLSNTYARADDAGASLFTSNVFASTDDAKTWSPAGPPIDPTLLLETIEVAASDPQRIYVSGTRGTGAATSAVILVSTDRAATWTEHAVPIDPSMERAAFISAVDPHDPNRVYVRTKLTTAQSTSGTSRLLVTDDAGRTFREVLKLSSDMLGFALSPDGASVWAGSSKDGLYGASTADLVFAQRSPIAVQCLTAVGSTLYACSSEPSGFILGASHDGGATFEPKLHLYCVRGPLACADGTSATQCAAQWPSVRDGLGTPPADAGADAGPSAPAAPTKSGGCSCDAARFGGGSGFATAAAIACALALFGARRRNDRR